MSSEDVQSLCAQGQQLLAAREYLDAERILACAEREAYRLRDWDTLGRLYMPLQETRRQRRQRCCEGPISLNLISQGPDDVIVGRQVVENYTHGQLLVAGWGTIEPALQVRKLQGRFGLYVDVFLAAAYPLIDGGLAIVIVPHEQAVLPVVLPRRLADFRGLLQTGCIVVRAAELPQEPRVNDQELLARLRGWWEAMHLPFLYAARETRDPPKRIDAYRKAIRVDYACELAHQELSATARELARITARENP